MTIMVAAFLFDQHYAAVAPVNVFSADTLSRALLFAVSTGCSGGFGSISSDVLGSLFIAVSVPTTAYLAAELAAYRSTHNNLLPRGRL